MQWRIQGRDHGEPGFTTLDKTTKQRANQSVSNTIYIELSLRQAQFSIWRLSPKRFPVLYEKTSIDCSQSPIFSWDRLDIPRLTVTAILIFKFWHSCKMAACNAKCSISMILRKIEDCEQSKTSGEFEDREMKNNAWKNVAENLSWKIGRTHCLLVENFLFSSSLTSSSLQNKQRQTEQWESPPPFFFFWLTVTRL